MCQDSSMHWVRVWLWVSVTMASDRSTQWFEENTCSARAEVTVFQSLAVFLKAKLVHTKDPVPANHRKGVVYSIPCAECPRTYIGQTGRSLDHRLREHRRALKNGDLGSSALAEHVFSSNHRVSGSIQGQSVRIYPRPWWLTPTITPRLSKIAPKQHT